MRRAQLAGVILAVVGLATAPAVQAAGPDDSAADQYTENIPGAGGENPSDAGGGPSGGNNDEGAALPSGAADQFQAAGRDGAAAANLAQATAPPNGAESNTRRDATNAATAQTETPNENRSSGSGTGFGSAIADIVDGSAGSGGMGIVLPILLGFSLLAAVAVALVRRRGHGDPDNA